MLSSQSNTLIAEGPFIEKYKLSFELEDEQDIYFGGDSIRGVVRVDYKVPSPSCIDIFLACVYRDHHAKTTLFKLMLSPSPIIQQNVETVPFVLDLPTSLPSSIADKTLPGTITFKLKAIHDMKNFPLCLQPKVSKKLLVLDRISSRKDEYQSPISNDKEISLACDKDILKDKVVRWNKGDNVPVSAKLFLPVSCYLPGQTLPICVQVKHVAPIKQMQGIQIHLERLVSVTKGNGEKSMDSQVVAQVTLPLICDVEDTSASINSHLDIPKDTIPTTLSASPIQVTYRLRAAVHVDMASLVEEPTTPLRKRDIAKGMVNSWGKRSNSVQESASTTSLFGSVLDLELPIVIGTTAAEPSSPTDDAKHFFLEDLPPQLPARRPKSAMFLTHQSSSPALFTSAEDEKKLLDRRLHHPKPPLPPRSVTDPFSLINHQQDTWSPVQPSAPDFHDFCTDTKIAP